MAARASGNLKTVLLIIIALVVIVAGGIVFVFAQARNETTKSADNLPVMTLQELQKYDGKEGRSAYFAYEGRVYDVSSSPSFKNGEHPGGHKAGEDLTGKLDGAPHGIEVFAPFKVVGKME